MSAPSPSRATTPGAVVGGPLANLRVVELASIGPGPHAAMMLADMGADVVRVQRPDDDPSSSLDDQTLRNRTLITLNLKSESDKDVLFELVGSADVLIEGFRPGVAERLGIGPDILGRRNPRLVYARMTGWGQSGPRAGQAGHDINYLALSGTLHAIGRAGERPVPPLNVVGDFGGGSMLLVVGILAAIAEREVSGLGQTVDAAMIDGITTLSQMVWSGRHEGWWSDQRAANLLDGAAPFYDTYVCGDGQFVAVGAMESKFYANLLIGLGLDASELELQYDRAEWPRVKSLIAERFRSQSRDHWSNVFHHLDACVTPVLAFPEVVNDPHIQARATVINLADVPQAAPAPRFSRTPADAPKAPHAEFDDATLIIARWRDSTAQAANTPQGN